MAQQQPWYKYSILAIRDPERQWQQQCQAKAIVLHVRDIFPMCKKKGAMHPPIPAFTIPVETKKNGDTPQPRWLQRSQQPSLVLLPSWWAFS